MPYTNDPAHNLSDRVRFLVQDTNVSSPELSDAEVAYLLDEEGDDAARAAARAAEVLAAKYSSQADEKQVGPLRIKSASDKSKKYQSLAKQLWARVTKTTGLPFAGGISVADKTARAQDPDRVHPTFARDMMAYPLAEASRVATSDETAL